MAIEFIPTRADRAKFPTLNHIIDSIINNASQLGIGDGVLYYGWPKYTDYESVRHSIDLALITKTIGLVLVRVLSAPDPPGEIIDSISQVSASAVSQLIRSPILRRRGRQLYFEVRPVIFAPGTKDQPHAEIAVLGSEQAFLAYLAQVDDQQLSEEQIAEIRSILEGAKALSRPSRRIISDPANQGLGISLRRLEEEIASFDARQRQVALTAIAGPQRIRGLAGSGKTVILAMKAALAHLEDPGARILVTYYTRSLRNHLTGLITRFYRHFGEGDPDWTKIDVYHGWGRQDLPGVYREACVRAGLSPLSFAIAQTQRKGNQPPFDYVCRALIDTGRVRPYYDLILIDEGQDFPESFYELCFHLAKGQRDQKQLVWAYDELQDVFDVRVRTPEELFGDDLDGKPRISLQRSLPENADTNDFVLPKCYRNQRDVLVLAHAIGFGLYGEPVQMLPDRNHWEDVGYEVIKGDMRVGTPVVIRRPNRNSPTHLAISPDTPLIEVESLTTVADEVEYCAAEFEKFLRGGLQPEDLMAIAIDDRSARTYLSALSVALSQRGLDSNNIIADRYSEPAFTIPGKITLSTVYRAKGNEAAVVAVLGCEAVPLNTRTGRNRLFTAFTRTKGWLRITGIHTNFKRLKHEIDSAIEMAPEMRFVMPDPAKIEMIQRDLSEKDSRLQRAQAEMERLKEDLGLTDDDLRSLIPRRRRNGR
jgi:superfamily I DNA and RNA helicase